MRRADEPPAWPALLAAVAGAAWLLSAAGWRLLDPSAVGWTLNGDLAQHVFGFLFYRRGPWTLPPDAIPDLAWPMGTTVALTDSNPWLCLAAKLLGGRGADELQLIGPWLVLCSALQGWAGARLTAAVGGGALHQLLGGALFALSPVTTFNFAHDTLHAQFLVVLALALHLRPPRRPVLACAVLVLVAAGVHPYLAGLVLVLALALLWRLARDQALAARTAAAAGVGLVFLATVVGIIFGAIGHAPGDSRGFAYFTADLLALVDPQGHSRLLAGVGADPRDGEVLAYLGLGTIGLVLLALLLVARGRVTVPWRRQAPLLAAVALATLVALSSSWRLGGSPLVRAGALLAGAPLAAGGALLVAGLIVAAARALARRTGWPAARAIPAALLVAPAVAGLGALNVLPFRVVGRFIWPLHHLALAAAVAAAVRGLSRRGAALAIGAAVALQLADLDTAQLRARVDDPGPAPPFPAWAELRGRGFRHVAMVPPQLIDGGGRGCPGGYDSPDAWIPLARLAFRLGATFNGGYVARLDGARAKASCRALTLALARGQLDPDTLYATTGAWEPILRTAGARCRSLEGWIFCAPPGR